MEKNSIIMGSDNVLEMGKRLLIKMGIKAKEVSVRGIHLYFVNDETHVICKIKGKNLFDFIEFANKEEAIEFFKKQRVSIVSEPRIIERKREGEICLRTFFGVKAF